MNENTGKDRNIGQKKERSYTISPGEKFEHHAFFKEHLTLSEREKEQAPKNDIY